MLTIFVSVEGKCVELKRFEITKFRNIQKSEWIDVERLTVIVGKNESGKTALLKALHKFNPFSPEPYNMNKEWPKGQRRERDAQTVVSTVEFDLRKDEQETLADLTDQKVKLTSVAITKNYAGQFEVQLPEEQFPDKLHPTDIDHICEKLPIIPDGVTDEFRAVAESCSEEAKRLADEGRFTDLESIHTGHEERLREVLSPEQPHQQIENPFIAAHIQKLSEVSTKLGKAASIHQKAHDYIIKSLPVFIYMDDYRTFTGTALLDQVQGRIPNSVTEEDKTLLMIMKLSGLDLDDEVKKGRSKDREQRQYDLDDASKDLTGQIKDRWRQKKYEVKFRADGQHFFTMVKDALPGSSLIPLEDRSRGFQWFFSFDLMFMHESQGTFKGCVILMDEPGLHLHPEAQSDLLRRLDAYAKGNTLIYSTHLPFMIDLREPARIRIITAREDGSSFVTQDISLSGPDDKLTLQAALGMGGSQSYLVAQKNLVVEGVDDFMIISELSNLFIRTGLVSISDDIFITAAGGASEAVYISTFMIGQELQVCALFDSDGAGRSAHEKLTKKWITKYKDAKASAILLGKSVGMEDNDDFAIEDLFPEDYYLGKVFEAYSKELHGVEKLDLKGDDLLVNKVARALADVGIDKFNKGSIAKLIRADIRQIKSASELPDGVKEKGQALFKTLRGELQ